MGYIDNDLIGTARAKFGKGIHRRAVAETAIPRIGKNVFV